MRGQQNIKIREFMFEIYIWRYKVM